MAAPKSNLVGIVPTADEPQWFRDAIIYEVHVRAFFDSNGDGKGDFNGLTQKLDYLRDLGITAIWVLPFYPSPLRDDGYDIADYRSVHAAYGDLADFKAFVRGAHDRGMRVITELVLNHTSDQHPWFQRARRAPKGSRWRNFYVWSDNTERYKEARIIFRDFEESNWAWDPVAGQYYWHRFYSHQPDLNFENAEVRRAMFGLVDYWLAMGVDGLRLDAVPYLFEEEGTSCENLPRTHAYLKELRKHIDEKYPGRMLLAEANQWPEDAVEYFGNGDECHMAFHFPLMPRLFMAVRMEDRFPIQEILDQTPNIPANTQWALFLRNHDELTLEMVTDEERDYMYRVYARDPEMRINLGIRRRLAPLLENNRRQIELLSALMFSLPGTPVIYYGDEIGMGDNVYLGDRNGVRTPMQWSSDRNAGFSLANPQRLFLPLVTDPEYRHDAVNVETQQGNLHGLLWWTKRLIDMRRRWRAFGRGTLEMVHSENRHVLAFIRRDGPEQVLVVANLSRFVQSAGLDLRCMSGVAPVELFGGSHFPPITEAPYPMSIGPHGFYWFSLTQSEADSAAQPQALLPVIATFDIDDEPQPGAIAPALTRALRAYLPRARWFRSKARDPRKIDIVESIPLRKRGDVIARFVVIRIDYREGEAERYIVPMAVVPATSLPENAPAVVARVNGASVPSFLVDATGLPEVGEILLDLIARRRTLEGEHGDLVGIPFQRVAANAAPPRDRGADQTNTSLMFGEQYMLKVFRKIEDGVNPEVEMTRALGGTKFPAFAHAAGAIEYRDSRTGAASVAVLQEYVPHEGTALDQTVDELERFFDRVVAA
ncbi:alpha-amylase, partial [bacterium SCGC AG-212-C10]